MSRKADFIKTLRDSGLSVQLSASIGPIWEMWIVRGAKHSTTIVIQDWDEDGFECYLPTASCNRLQDTIDAIRARVN